MMWPWVGGCPSGVNEDPLWFVFFIESSDGSIAAYLGRHHVAAGVIYCLRELVDGGRVREEPYSN